MSCSISSSRSRPTSKMSTSSFLGGPRSTPVGLETQERRIGGAFSAIGFPRSTGSLQMRRSGYPFHSAMSAESGWWGGPPGPRGTPPSPPRPAAGGGGGAPRAGGGTHPTQLCWRRLAESRGYPLAAKWVSLNYTVFLCARPPPGSRRFGPAILLSLYVLLV